MVEIYASRVTGGQQTKINQTGSFLTHEPDQFFRSKLAQNKIEIVVFAHIS